MKKEGEYLDLFFMLGYKQIYKIGKAGKFFSMILLSFLVFHGTLFLESKEMYRSLRW